MKENRYPVALLHLWGLKGHRQAIANIKNCNLYNCSLSEVNWDELAKADLDFI